MEEFLKEGEFVASVILVMTVTQAVLYGISRGLEQVMNRTTTPWDNRAHSVIKIVLTVIDTVTGNREHREHKDVGKSDKNITSSH